MTKNKPKLLIIGGDSFIGRNFINHYQDHLDLTIVSRKSMGHSNEIILDDFFMLGDENFLGKDCVINFAAIVHQPQIRDEKPYYRVNYQLAVELAKRAKRMGVFSFIQMSSIAVYGSNHISIEKKCNPLDPYGRSKLKADLELQTLQDDSFRVVCLRPSMVYGFPGTPGNLQSLIKLAKFGIPLPVKREGNMRQFLHIEHLLQALYQLSTNISIRGVVILSDEEAVSTKYLIKRIAFHLGKGHTPFFTSRILIWIIEKLRPNLANKLYGDLVIENNYSFDQLGITQILSVDSGIRKTTINIS